MNVLRNPLAAGIVAALMSFAGLAEAQTRETGNVDELLAELADPSTENWEEIEAEIQDIWSRSGSRSMDFLLERGREALEAEDYRAAVEHFTALTDHAPDFAEGWNMRATAFFLQEEYGLSLADIGRTLALNPDHFSALAGLGIILEELEDYPNSLKAYEAAQKLNPHHENVKEAITRLTRRVAGWDI